MEASRQSRDLSDPVFLKHNSKVIGECCIFKFVRRSVDGKPLVHFQSDIFVLKFLRRSVNAA